MRYGLFIAAICLLCHSCIHKQADDGVYGAVVYYRDSVSDTYKQRAAQFLIDNMDVHYTLQSEGIDSFRLYMDDTVSKSVSRLSCKKGPAKFGQS